MVNKKLFFYLDIDVPIREDRNVVTKTSMARIINSRYLPPGMPDISENMIELFTLFERFVASISINTPATDDKEIKKAETFFLLSIYNDIKNAVSIITYHIDNSASRIDNNSCNPVATYIFTVMPPAHTDIRIV